MMVCLPARPRKRRSTSSSPQVLAVHGEEEVPLLHVDARLRERRAQLRVPVLAAEDAGDR
jgi:hypothetical protein